MRHFICPRPATQIDAKAGMTAISIAELASVAPVVGACCADGLELPRCRYAAENMGRIADDERSRQCVVVSIIDDAALKPCARYFSRADAARQSSAAI